MQRYQQRILPLFCEANSEHSMLLGVLTEWKNCNDNKNDFIHLDELVSFLFDCVDKFSGFTYKTSLSIRTVSVIRVLVSRKNL